MSRIKLFFHRLSVYFQLMYSAALAGRPPSVNDIDMAFPSSDKKKEEDKEQ